MLSVAGIPCASSQAPSTEYCLSFHWVSGAVSWLLVKREQTTEANTGKCCKASSTKSRHTGCLQSLKFLGTDWSGSIRLNEGKQGGQRKWDAWKEKKGEASAGAMW